MRPIAFAKIRVGGTYEVEVSPLALLMYSGEEFFITVVAKNDLILQQVSLRAMVVDQAYGDFKAFVLANGGHFDAEDAKEDIAAAVAREAAQTRH